MEFYLFYKRQSDTRRKRLRYASDTTNLQSSIPTCPAQNIEWILFLISFLDRIYRIDGIFFACELPPGAEGPLSD